MYSVHRLRLLREVSLRGTLAAAAQALGYNPSSVSHQLRLLEEEVGAALLEPFGRGVRLTLQGKILVRHAEVILQQLESAEADIAVAQQDVQGVVRAATFQTALHTALPPALWAIRAAHPQLGVQLTHVSAEVALPALLARDFDLVVLEDYPGFPRPAMEGAEVSGVGLDRMWLITPAGSDNLPLDQLREQDWVMEAEGTQARQWAESMCRSAGFEPRVCFESSDVLAHVKLVGAGLAVALVPGLALSAVGSSDVQAHPLPGEPARRISVALRRGGGHAPAVSAVREAVAEAVADCLR